LELIRPQKSDWLYKFDEYPHNFYIVIDGRIDESIKFVTETIRKNPIHKDKTEYTILTQNMEKLIEDVQVVGLHDIVLSRDKRIFKAQVVSENTLLLKGRS
jgi:protease II